MSKEDLLEACANVQEAAKRLNMRCLAFGEGVIIPYPNDMVIYKLGTKLTINDSGCLCPCMLGEPFVCIVGETSCP